MSRLARLRQRDCGTEYLGTVVLSFIEYWEMRSPGLLPDNLSSSLFRNTHRPWVTGALQDFCISQTARPAQRPYLPAATFLTPRCLLRTLAPRYTYIKTNQGATSHTNFWFCSQPHPPPLPPPTLRKPDVQMVNREKKIPPRPLETRLVWLGFQSAQRLLHVCYL